MIEPREVSIAYHRLWVPDAMLERQRTEILEERRRNAGGTRAMSFLLVLCPNNDMHSRHLLG